MTPEQQRIAIAEATGWKWEGGYNPRRAKNILCPPKGPCCTVWKDGQLGGTPPPDFLNDLNAMHEAEKARIIGNVETFDGATSVESEYRRMIDIFDPASERAVAFLKALRLWKEVQP